MENKIINGNSLEELKKLPEKSINMVMTSPPYWALRDYGVEGQLGLEPTFDEYINKLCDIFDEVKRVLRDDGTCWVNLGDTYGGSGGSSGHNEDTKNLGYSTKNMGAVAGGTKTYQPKCLVMIPMRFAIEMVNRGWILRNVIIWHKSNCMPSSVKDRFTVDFEYLFFFSKQKNYYFETQREPHLSASIKRMDAGFNENQDFDYTKRSVKWEKSLMKGQQAQVRKNHDMHYDGTGYSKEGRNKRTVWNINPKPFKESHFAVYPEELCETPIKAGCPEFVCVKCGNVKERVYERSKEIPILEADSDRNNPQGLYKKIGGQYQKELNKNPPKDLGYKPTCNCNAGFTGGTVLDPFFGSGTTGLVALKQNKKFIGIELNPEYIKIANKRLKPFLEQRKL